MNHPHVLRVFGFCTKPADPTKPYDQEHKYIITEFAPNGSLESAIRGAEKIAQIIKENDGGGVIEMPFTKIQALEWSLQIASGMVYLHTRGFMRKFDVFDVLISTCALLFL